MEIMQIIKYFLGEEFLVWETIQKLKKQCKIVYFDYWLLNLWPNPKKMGNLHYLLSPSNFPN